MARQRGNRWQADAVIEGKRVRRSFETEALADAWSTAHEPETPLPAVAAPETLAGLATSLQLNLWGSGDQAIAALRHVKEAQEILGPTITFRQLKPVHVQLLTSAYLAAGLQAGTINRRFASLSKLCSMAVDLELMATIPKFKRRKEPEGRTRFLTNEEEDRLFAELRAISARTEELFIFLVDTGARLGEAFSLKPYQLDFEAGTITFDKTKADVTRTVFMTTRVRTILERTAKQQTPFSDVNRWTIRDHWNRAKKAAGFEHDPLVVPHILRHTCASRIVQAGLGLKLAQTQLGHKNASMTDRYAHLDHGALSRVVDTLERRGRAA